MNMTRWEKICVRVFVPATLLAAFGQYLFEGHL
jgi:hypothetical protein